MVLEHLQAHHPEVPIRYWRDKAGREVDFVLTRARDTVDAVECKWDAAAFDASSLQIFRSSYPRGTNYLVAPQGEPSYRRRFGKLEVTVCNPEGIAGGDR